MLMIKSFMYRPRKTSASSISVKIVMILIGISYIFMSHIIIARADQAHTLKANSFFEQRNRGWLWFDEAERLRQDAERKKKNTMPTIAEMEQAKRENEEVSKELDLLKHLAVRHPENLEYIKLYKLKEKEMMDRAELLGLNWLLVNFLNPDIVDELKSPQNLYGRNIQATEVKQKEQKTLRDLSQKIEIFVFRKDVCLYSDTLEKHLKTFAIKYGFKVEAVTPDHSKSKYFKTHSNNIELITALKLEIMPTVIAVVNDSRERFELARGTVSVVDLEEKSLLLAQVLGINTENNEYKNRYITGSAKEEKNGAKINTLAEDAVHQEVVPQNIEAIKGKPTLADLVKLLPLNGVGINSNMGCTSCSK